MISGGYTGIKYEDHHISYNDGWSLTLPGKEAESVELPLRVELKGSETAVFSNVLPTEIPEHMALITRNYHLLLKATIDGEEIFSYPGNDWNGFANIVSDEWCMVDIMPEYAGKTITFSFTNTSDALFEFSNYVGEFYYGTDNSLVYFVRNQGFWKLILGVIVSAIGALLLIVSFIYKGHTKQSTNTAMGTAFLCFGIWMCNRAKMSLFPDNSLYIYWLSLMCLMLVAPFIFLYSYYRNNTFKKLSLYMFRFCLVADVFMIFSCMFINYSIEYITPFAYFLSTMAMLLTSYSLFLGGWGKESTQQRKIDRLLDRTEFFSTLIYPTLGFIEVIIGRDELWTEFSLFFMIGITVYVITYFSFILWRTFLVVQDRTNVTRQLHDSQLELMMGQIQPHFMFNTLSSIRTLIKIDPDVAYDMVYNFSNYLRANVDNLTNLEGIPFSSEVQHIQSYVEIEKVRLGDRLTVEYDIKAEDFTVPPLSIQPLVENAIKHGIRKKPGGGTVLLKSYSLPDCNVIEVSDNGMGFDAESAIRVFGTYADESSILNGETTEINMDLMRDVMDALDLKDAEGNPIILASRMKEEKKKRNKKVEPEESEAQSSSEALSNHKSSGMTNVLLRLRDMSNAKIEISSKEGEGTLVKVYFPK